MTRICGDCTLCCKLVPVAELQKRAGQRCEHQRAAAGGCAIYPDRPHSCQTWSCAWLVDPSASRLGRPDRAHYVIDLLPDEVFVRDEVTGERIRREMIQVWIDPAFGDAWRDDDELLKYVERLAERTGMGVLVRTANMSAQAVFAPCISPARNGRWLMTPPTAPDTSIGRYASLPQAERPPL